MHFWIFYNVIVVVFKGYAILFVETTHGNASIDIFEDWDSMFLLHDMYFPPFIHQLSTVVFRVQDKFQERSFFMRLLIP
jgi:hypothetical protein